MPINARSRATCIIAVVAAFALALFWQWEFGAYRSEFGGHPDEAAHVVTGLFVRDAFVEGWSYAVSGFHGSPLRIGREFADRYYTHYPKIGLGVWPPFFYLVQASWTLPFGASRVSLLLLLGVLAAILGGMVFRALRDEFGASLASVAAALLLSLPLVRTYYGMVMAETLSAVLMFGAMLAFGAFLDGEKRRDAIWFGVLAALAILTKGTGLVLGLAAPLALLITRRFHLLARPALWLSVAIVVVVAGPWTWATRNLGKGGWLQPDPSWSFTREALPYYAGKWAVALGAVLLLLFAIGVLAKIGDRSRPLGRWAAVGAMIPAVIVFQSIAPVGLEARHLIPILPAGLMFAAAGFDFVARRLSGWKFGVLAVGVLLGTSWTVWTHGSATMVSSGVDEAGNPWAVYAHHAPATKGCSGFVLPARTMLSEAAPEDVALVSSDATGEGMFIAEVALHEARPGHVIQRASKSLASSTWSGSGYTPAFARDDDVHAFLTSGKIRYLILDDAVPGDKRRAHHDQLKRVVDAHPDQFQVVVESELWRGGQRQSSPVKLYRITRKD